MAWTAALTGQQAWDYLQAADYDAAILAIMMPHLDGLSVLKNARHRQKTTPVLLLTARDAIADRVAGLDSGANDYLVKPLRAGGAERPAARADAFPLGAGDSRLVAGDLTLDTGTRREARGREIALSARNMRCWNTSCTTGHRKLSPAKKIEKSRLEFRLRGRHERRGRAHPLSAQKKIDDGHERKPIHTVRGMGYVLREETP